MARLTVKLRGEEVASLNLEPGNEYIAGRAGDAQIQLANERGISRHHLKFYEREGVWVCESLSKFVLLHKGAQSMEVLELIEATAFSVPPYDFEFTPSAREAPAPSDDQKPSENLPAFYQPRISPQHSSLPENTSPRVNNEATVAGVAMLVPYIRVSYPNTADDEVLKLEGQLWVAGRDPGCEIPIDSAHVSRKHFELARTKEGFFITDLGSSNGTKVNGMRIPAHEPTRIDSGDEIRVMNVSMQFEIRDTHFGNRLENLPVPAFDPMLAAPPMPWYPPAAGNDAPTILRSPLEEFPSDWKKIRPRHLKNVNWKKNKVRVALVVLIPIVLILAMLPDKPKTPAQPAPGSGESQVFANLTPEQKNVVKDSFNLARNLYVQGKYELCLSELAKVHEILPQYENSKELQSFCEQGRELVIRQREYERREREKQMVEQQITGYVETCKAKLSADASVEETRQCLADAIELSPEHTLILEMIQGAQLKEEEKQFRRQQEQQVAQKAAKGRAHYEKAKSFWKKGKLSRAVSEYERFLDSVYPRIDDEKEQARREVAAIRKELKTKVDTLLQECKSLGSKNQYKQAWYSCDKAVDEDPNHNEAKELRERMHVELKREMKSIYEDSVLEESLGNVDSAKEKWKKIMKENLEFDEYSVKAKSKLQKYGIFP